MHLSTPLTQASAWPYTLFVVLIAQTFTCTFVTRTSPCTSIQEQQCSALVNPIAIGVWSQI